MAAGEFLRERDNDSVDNDSVQNSSRTAVATIVGRNSGERPSAPGPVETEPELHRPDTGRRLEERRKTMGDQRAAALTGMSPKSMEFVGVFPRNILRAMVIFLE
jgi:hypothetical protein